MVSRSAAVRPARAPGSSRETAGKRLAILGATGSIGRSCAQVIGAAPGRFAVASVAGGRDGAALARIAVELGAEFAAIADPAGFRDLKAALAGSGIEAAAGPEAVREAALREADLVVSAIVGAAGLEPTFAAVAAGRTVALANKETLVCAGAAVMQAAERAGALLLPMDSEHNALFQAIGARDPATIEMMTITASGGPFREWSAERIASATREEALAHPNWVMGPKVTIDFGRTDEQGARTDRGAFPVRPAAGEARRRRASAIDRSRPHRFRRRFADRRPGLARHAHADRALSRLSGPDRLGVRPPDLAALGRLTFERADLGRFPALAPRHRRSEGRAEARRPRSTPPTRSPSPRSSIGRIGFGDIARLVARAISTMDAAGELAPPQDVAQALAIHHIAVERATRLLA